MEERNEAAAAQSEAVLQGGTEPAERTGNTDPAAQAVQEVQEVQAVQTVQTVQEDSAGREAPAPAGPVIRAKYNKRELAFTGEEAAPLVQKGLKFEAIEPDYRRLKRLALAEGVGVSELLDRLLRESDEAAYRRALEDCGGNARAAEKLAAFQRREQEERAGGREADTAEREFREVDAAFPGRFAGAEELPVPVVELAARRGLPLLDAVLRFDHEQKRQAEAARVRQEAAAKASAGSMTGESARADLDAEAFSAAFAAALH